jgi:transcriptional regulator with XRE-family HTH domain
MVTQKIRFLREQKKLRHEDMAERLGISPSTYQRLESGETKMDVERLKKIAEVLEVNPDDLLNSDPIVFNVSNNSGGAYANYGHIGHLIPEEFVQRLMDRIDVKHEAHVKNLEAMNQRLMDLLEKKG